ncbi:MAG: CDP-glucose 4,6-dehydratase [Bacilli bacterium]|nr:CDP-glucose 4,6-dehydratase [Bacilli bacterium]
MLDFYKGKKVFITGHTGFKGSWLSKILIMSGAEVTGYALESPTNPNLFSLLNLDKKMNSVIGDIRDLKKLSDAINKAKPEIVIHMAAQPIVRDSYKDPVYTYETNVMGTVNIMEAVRNCNSVKSFLNVTTDKVYKNNEWVWGYRENEELCGYDPYSNSKSCSELVTYSYLNSFFKDSTVAISTARSGNVIGGGDFANDRIIPDCIRAAEKKEDIIVRNPHSTRPYQHVLDCLNGYLLLAKKQYEDITFAGNYNFGPDDESCVTTGELVDLFCNSWTNIKWIDKFDGGPHEANFLKLDCSKSKKQLEWQPKIKIKEAIDLIVEWSKVFNDKKNISKITEEQINNYFGGL